MTINIFVEIEERMDVETPFNILPASMAYYSNLLSLAVVLPSSPSDLTHYWVRPKHSIGTTPIVNFPYKEDIEKLVTYPPLFRESNLFVFFCKKGFSKPLVRKISNLNLPCIIFTDNSNFEKEMRKFSNIQTVLHKKNEDLRSLFYECHQNIIKLFVARKEISFSGAQITEEFLKTYALCKTFLETPRLTHNLLCSANELVFSQVRAQFPKILSFNESSTYDTDAAIVQNVKLMYEILAEKIVDNVLGNENHETCIPIKVNPELSIKCRSFLDNFSEMSDETRLKEYSELKNIASANLSKIRARSELVLLVPTVNSSCRDNVIDILKNKIPKEEALHIVDKILKGGIYFEFDENKLSPTALEISKSLIEIRSMESRFLTFSTALFASRRLSPVLKCPTVPSSLFIELLELRKYVRSRILSMLQNHQYDGFLTIGQKFIKLQKELADNIPQKYLQAIDNSFTSNIMIISDLPFELAKSNSGLAICQSFPCTRIPITPMVNVFRYISQTSRRGFVEKKMRMPKQILMLNSIRESDPIHREVVRFKRGIEKVGVKLEYHDVKSSEDFISNLNQNNPSIMVYYGHARYNDATDEGELIFEKDRFSFKDISKIKKMPDILFLMGCEVASCSAFTGGLPIHFLTRDTFAILAPILPIPADEAANFLGRLLTLLRDVPKIHGVDLSNAVFEIRKLGWLRDNLGHLLRIGAITREDYTKIFDETSRNADVVSTKLGYNISISQAIDIFKDVLAKYEKLDTWLGVNQNIVPYSLFFSLIGDANNVIFV